ncbi:hypothetical protein HK101_007998 [Irineochytrium annulatum]|nr:hypothetical protein HK101_007998 [Irineochytrium annulatum]
MVAYGEFRRSFEKDPADHRIVLYGMRYIIEKWIHVPWTKQQVDLAAKFFKTHNASLNTSDKSTLEFPFPKELFYKFIDENEGYFPVKIESLPEGSVIYPHVPVYQITAEKEYSRLVTYLETILTQVWLSFTGTDTLPAAYYAQMINNGVPVASSIPATEHSVMTAYRNEKKAMTKLLEIYGGGICACVMDSYDYANALDNVLPSVKKLKVDKGGVLVLRPDSGDPVKVVLQALKAAEATFKAEMNSKGYKVISGVSVIQGDGINHKTLKDILTEVEKEKFSAINVAFGMGGGLLQKVNRDTMSFATKLSYIEYADAKEYPPPFNKRDVMKNPKTDASKISLPGQFIVVNDKTNFTKSVLPKGETKRDNENALIVVYDGTKKGGPRIPKWDTFDEVRKRLNCEWEKTKAHKTHDAISAELKRKMQKVKETQAQWQKE